MKQTGPQELWALLCALAAAATPFSAPAADAEVTNNVGTVRLPRIRSSFDFDWKFLKADCKSAAEPGYDDSVWRPLNLPHDWSIEGPPNKEMHRGRANGFFPGGIGWYRKHFAVPVEFKGRKVFIQFDGVYHRSDVYLNGQHLGRRPYGYVSFQYDLTPHLNFGGTNVLAVRVDHSDAPTSRWYSGSGIYRHVWLTVTAPLHVAHWGTYVTTPRISAKSAAVRIRTAVQNESTQTPSCVLVTAVEDRSGRVLASEETRREIPAMGRMEFDQTLEISSPTLWSLQAPYLYVAQTAVKVGGQVVDIYETPFGVRGVRFDPQRGFFLNGESMKLKGVCLHHDAGCLGAAVPVHTWERRLEALRTLGCNAIRMSHNPPAPELLDLCDHMGFLVIDEAFDKWRSGYYKEYFHSWWQRDLEAMIKRDRNHPCIILWSVGNEVAEQGTPEGARTLQMLLNYVHRQEPSRLVTYAAHPNRREGRSVNSNGFGELLDVVSYNYQEQWYEADKRQYPNRIILGSECYPFFRGRADYGTDRKVHNIYCDFSPANPWYDVERDSYAVGQFIWAGIDYLGESSGWPSKGWPNGLIDTCGFLKPRSGFHRSVWKSDPMVQLVVLDDALDVDPGRAAWSWPRMALHWNFPRFKGSVIRVETFSNCQSVELLLNGESLGVRRPEDYSNSTILWYVPYEAGSLRAIGKNEGNEVATDELLTAGPPAGIVLAPDRAKLAADGQDVSHIEVRLVDAKGVLVPDGDRLIRFAVKGPGAIIGVDNGDLRCPEPYKANQRTTHWGRCLVILQATRQAGTIEFTATASNLPPATVTIESKPSG